MFTSNNKCYACGQTDSHLVNCPTRKLTFPGKTLPDVKNEQAWIVKSHHPPKTTIVKDVDTDPPKDIDIADPTSKIEDIRIGNCVLGFNCHAVQGGETVLISVQPQLHCKLYRLWVSDECAPFFDIESIIVGHSHLLADSQPIAASFFTRALRDKYPLTTDWEYLVEPSQRVTLIARNTYPSTAPKRFQAIFEVRTFDPGQTSAPCYKGGTCYTANGVYCTKCGSYRGS